MPVLIGHELQHDAVLDATDVMHRTTCPSGPEGARVAAGAIVWRSGAAPVACMQCWPTMHTKLNPRATTDNGHTPGARQS